MKISITKTPFFNQLFNEWHSRHFMIMPFKQFLENKGFIVEYDRVKNAGIVVDYKQHMHFVFDSEQDYFLTLMKFL